MARPVMHLGRWQCDFYRLGPNCLWQVPTMSAEGEVCGLQDVRAACMAWQPVRSTLKMPSSSNSMQHAHVAGLEAMQTGQISEQQT